MLAGQVARQPTVEEAYAYCRRVTLGRYENFTVASWFLPRGLRPHMYAIYAYCRGVDDLGDEASGDRLARLEEWERELLSCYGGEPSDVRLIALKQTIKDYTIPAEPFLRLIEANRRDQRIHRYGSFEQLLEYCSYSANPVGELVLHLFGYRDVERRRLSDATCTALQLANFWQDTSRDLDAGRVYIPLEDIERFGYSEMELLSRRHNGPFRQLLAFEVNRTREFFREGLDLIPLVAGRLRLDLRLFSLGGLAVLDAIERSDYRVLQERPTLSKGRKAFLAMRGLLPLPVRVKA